MFQDEVTSRIQILHRLAQYKTKASSNYTFEGNISGYGYRTGPYYGSCCANFVCEVLGGSFVNNGTPITANVGGVERCANAEHYYNCKFSDVKIGDALSDYPNKYHVIWIGDITDSQVTIYEQAPPVCRKKVVSIESCKDKNGYFVYGGLKYSTITA